MININCLTCCHRDKCDCSSCIVIPFGVDIEGGELVLEETGQIFRMQAGDILIFKSMDLTHFNLHYSGIRGSIVIHTDLFGEGWTGMRNGLWSYIMSGTKFRD